jgi:mannose-1-phosphate guanylyltransferase
VRAVVLVGGFGTRLRPLTNDTPKQMLPVAGRPMIERVLAHLAGHGIDEVVLSLGYRPDAFTEAYPDATCAGVRLVYAVEPEPLDTAGAIAFAARHAGLDERFLVVNGDILTDLDLAALVELHERSGAEGTIALTKVDDPSQFGVVPTDEHGRVEAFVEKPAPGEAPTDLINAGFYVLEPGVLDRIPAGVRVNVERQTFPAMVAEGTLFARPDGAYWLDVGTPERFLQASLDLLDGRRVERLHQPAPSGDVAIDLTDPVVLGSGVRVAAGARVARAVLGDGVEVGAGALVEASVLLPGAVVGVGAVVRRAVLGAGAVVGPRACVEALSVLGDGARVDEGEVLSGVRRPEPEPS